MDVSWHHDCSNTSYLTQDMDWPMGWWDEDYLVTAGDMTSDGTSLSFSGIPAASSPVRWHGPMYIHTMAEPLALGDFQGFAVDFDIDNTDTTDSAIIRVYLCDSDFTPAMEIFCSDSWDWRSYGNQRAVYRFSNGSYVYHGNTDYITWTTFDGSISIWSESNGDLHADVPGFGSSLLLSSEYIEVDREVHYIVIQAARLAGYAWMPAKIRDIQVDFTISAIPTATSPTSPSTTPIPTGVPWDEYLLPISPGSGVVIVIMVGVICLSRRGPSGEIVPSAYDW